jgi:transcriptional regulator with XRE-family HTH domain
MAAGDKGRAAHVSNNRSGHRLDKALGERVRKMRSQSGVTQQQMAEYLGVTFQQVQKYERGLNRIPASRLLDIAAVLKTTVDEICVGVADQRARERAYGEPSFLDVLLSEEGAELLALFSTITNARVRRRTVDLVRAVIEDEEASASNFPSKSSR